MPRFDPTDFGRILARLSGLSGGLSRRTVFGSTPTKAQARRCEMS
jgi:hypothetical protein